MQTAFDLLADPTRRRLLNELLQGERSVGDLVERLDMSQPAVSRQLRILRNAGFATVRAQAQRRLYSLNPEALREVDDWLAPYRAQWNSHLDALERTLDSMED